MNERIRELAAEAEDYADRIVDHGGEFHSAYTKKFAELIVRACAKVSERTGSLNEADFEGEMIADAIKEYFGVLENERTV